MNAAVQAVAGGSMSQRQACEEYHVPRATLQKILTGKTHKEAVAKKKDSKDSCGVGLGHFDNDDLEGDFYVFIVHSCFA